MEPKEPNKVFTKTHILYLIIALLVASLWFTLGRSTEGKISGTPQGISKVIPEIPISTQVEVLPRFSNNDYNIELEQKYTAKINGTPVSVPIVTKENPYGVKGSIKQEIDITPIVSRIAEAERIQWETGVGIGVHQGDPYILLGVQRNFNKDSALEAEVHLKPSVKSLEVTGGSLMYKKLF